MSRFAECKLEHVFDIVVEFGADRTIFGPLPGGDLQGYTPPIGGRISGPRLNGSVVPRSGADYAIMRSDGVLELEAHYMLQADDGTLIYIVNRGYLVRAPETGGEKNEQGLVQPAYFRCTPTFRVPAGPHDSLARTVFIGAAERRQNPDHSVFRYYAVR